MRQFGPRKLLDLPPDFRGRQYLRASICFDGSILLLSRDSAGATHLHHLFADHCCELPGVGLDHEFLDLVQLHPDGSLVLARSRSNARDEANLFIVGQAGGEIRRFAAGDGIWDIQVDAHGRIWVSYFDEGVFGNTIGKEGLVCFDTTGMDVFRFHRDAFAPSISDCYALNDTHSGSVWCCYYVAFPLVRIVDGKAEVVLEQAPVRGSSAFAIAGEHLVFAGGYDDRDAFLTFSLATGEMEKLTAVDGEDEGMRDFSVFARDDRMLIESGPSLYEFRISSSGSRFDALY